MSRTLRRPLAVIAALAAMTLAGCASGPTSESLPSGEATPAATITVGVTPIANAAPVYLGIDQGFFEEQNLEVTPTIIQAAAAAIPSLLNDELQFALVSPVPTITGASKGLPLNIVLANDHYGSGADFLDGAALIASANSGLSDVTELEGKTIAVVGLRSAPELAMRLTLEANDVDPDSVDFVEIAYPDMVSALQSDRVDAAVVVTPFLTQAKADGLALLSQPFVDGLGGEVGTTWVASSTFLDEEPDVAVRFTTAMTKAVAYAAENPAEVRRIMATYTEMSEQALANALLPVYNSQITDANIQFFADAMYAQGFIEDEFDTAGVLWKP
ncbi:MAG: ABC transporter substrate-binding protein [Microbacterium sp.]|uniref:ABC transporter substrate-binding protein n=1 Tax=Microbacterium sp. TaxID=51671 RepID=UPI003A89CF2A